MAPSQHRCPGPSPQEGTQVPLVQVKPLLQTLLLQQAWLLAPQAVQLLFRQTKAPALQAFPAQQVCPEEPQLPQVPPRQTWLLPQAVPSFTLVQVPAEHVLQGAQEGLPSVQQVPLVTQRFPQIFRPLGHWPLQGVSGLTHSVPQARKPSLHRI